MNKKRLSEALGLIDDELINDSLTYPVRSDSAPERKQGMFRRNENGKIVGLGKLPVSLIACALALVMAVSAYAADMWGIKSMWKESHPQGELSDEALQGIVEHNDSALGDGWSARVTESLADAGSVLVTVSIRCDDKYMLVPADAEADDPARSIDIDSDMKIGEYARAKQKTLMYAGAVLKGSPELFSQSQQMKFVSDTEMMILIQADKLDFNQSSDVKVVPYVLTQGEEKRERLEIPIDLSALSSRALTYTPENAQALSGLTLGEAALNVSALGVNGRIDVQGHHADRVRGNKRPD